MNLFKFKKVQKKNFSFIFISILSITFLISDIFDLSFIKTIKSTLHEQTLPAKYFANKIIEIPKVLSEYMHVKKENAVLKMKIDELKIKLNTIQNMEVELKELKQHVGLKYSFSDYKYIEKVLGFDKSPYESYMIISVTNPTTTAGKIVISSDGLIGVIFDSNDKIARVMTICDQRLNVPIKSKNEKLIISGIDKNQMVFKEIKEKLASTESNFEIGEILYTSGEGGFFPINIPVAKITAIEKLSNKIVSTPLSNIAQVSYVWVISPITG
ncbi:MAG: rod shape-determining protein MreC [Holosporales bacterium]|jgi:rod shape-determining protein MreC|nr:rod shape-determining protein MreC [Holosporales bacterium]